MSYRYVIEIPVINAEMQVFTFFLLVAEPCSEVPSSWYGRLSQCRGILVAYSVFIAKLVQVSGLLPFCMDIIVTY